MNSKLLEPAIKWLTLFYNEMRKLGNFCPKIILKVQLFYIIDCSLE